MYYTNGLNPVSRFIDSLRLFCYVLEMKKYFFLSFMLLILSLPKSSYGFDVTGLQPVSPYGVFSTFSAESLPKGKIALSADAEILFDQDFYRFLFKSAYGITDTIEVDVTIPYIYKWADRVDGFEDIAVGFKHRFLGEKKYGPSIAYILNASIPSGRDEFTTEGSFGGGLIVSKRVGPVMGHFNVLYEKPCTGSLHDEVILAAGIDFAAAHNMKLLAELYSKKGFDSKKFDSTELRVGYRVKASDMLYTTVGAAFDIETRDPQYRLLFSVSFLLPGEKKVIKKLYEEE
jgi:hypothetical protein